MIGYSTLYKSMNGIKILSDGVSTISEGQAQHDSIIYNDFIYSDDLQTKITNDKLQTVNVECTNFDADNIMSLTIETNSLKSKYILVEDNSGNDLFIVDGLTNNKITSNIPMDIYETLNVIDSDIHQTQTGRIYQQGTNNNYLKDTYINGYLEIGSNLTQSGGSSSLKDLTIDNLTMRTDKSITQTGNNTNSFGGTTTIKNLIITDSVLMPSNVNIPQMTTNDDIVMQTDSVIIQDITTITTNKNILRDTKTQNLEIDGDITQIKGGANAILKNTTIQGTAQIQGDITQTAGTTILKTLRCNNITLNDDQIIAQSGTGYITQSGTGQNILKEINLLSNGNLIFNGSGIISQPLNGINILSHYRTAGFGIIGGRNNTTYTNYQNIQNNNGLQFQFNRDNSTQYSFFMNNRGTGGNGGFRFQRYIGGVYLDEPLIIDDNITMNKNLTLAGYSLNCSSATIGNISQSELNCLDNLTQNINTKFTSLDNQITSILNTNNSVNSTLSGISYDSVSDSTTIDNIVFINKDLVVKQPLQLIDITNTTSNASKFFHYINDLYIQNTINNGSIKLRTNNSSGTFSDNYIFNDTNAYFYRDVRINAGKKLYIGSMDIEAEINALDTSFTTGTINSTDLTTINLNVSNNAIINNLTTSGNSILNNLTVNNNSNLNNLTVSGTTTLNNLNLSKSIINPNINVFENLTPTITNPKTTFTSSSLYSLIMTINLSSTYKKRFLITSPISYYRQAIIGTQNMNISNNINVVLSSLSVDIKKNGTTIQSFTPSFNETLPKTYTAVKTGSSTGQTYFFEVYMGYINFYYELETNSFNNDIYTIYLNSNISVNYESETLLLSCLGTNTDCQTFFKNTYISSISGYSNTYTTKSYSILMSETNSINNNSLLATNDILCKNINITNTINTSNINTTTITTSNLAVNNISTNCQFDGYIRTKSNIAGYLLNGASYFESMPILCSIKGVLPDNNDDYYWVNAGYKIELYRDGGYTGGLLQTIDNTNSFSPNVFDVINKNTTSSIKVYYLNVEITMPYIS